MYFGFLPLLLGLAIQNSWALVLREPQVSSFSICPGGACLPRHLCPTGKFGGVAEDDLVPIDVQRRDQRVDQCGDFMKVCCIGASDSISSLVVKILEAVPAVLEAACGIRNSGGLVYRVNSNLTYAEYAEFPWTVVIFQYKYDENNIQLEHVGGGSLIHPKFVLTAAHTLKQRQRFVARLGEWNLRSDAEKYASQDIDIVEHLYHPLYQDICIPEHDIALAVLKKSVTYTAHISPICLPDPGEEFVGERCTATGWGREVQTQEFPDIMKRIVMTVFPWNRCNALYREVEDNYSFNLHRDVLCAGGLNDEDTCEKDGGSPLVCPREDGSYVLTGIVSWGMDCGNSAAPGVYVDVAKYVHWINSKTRVVEESNSDE